MNQLHQSNVSEVDCEVVFRHEVQVKHFSIFSKKDVKEHITYL